MELVHYRGAYRFADRAALEGALAAALGAHDEWRGWFCPVGDAVRVELDLPARRADQRRSAAHVMQTLALMAVEGIVVARQRELAIDVFVCGHAAS